MTETEQQQQLKLKHKHKELEYLKKEDFLCQLKYNGNNNSTKEKEEEEDDDDILPTNINSKDLIEILQNRNSSLVKENKKLSLQNSFTRNELDLLLKKRKELQQDLQHLQTLLEVKDYPPPHPSKSNGNKDELKKLRLELLEKNRQLEILKQSNKSNKKKKIPKELSFSRIIMKHHLKSSSSTSSSVVVVVNKIVQTDWNDTNNIMTQTNASNTNDIMTQTNASNTNNGMTQTNDTNNVYTQCNLVDESSTTTSTQTTEVQDNIKVLVGEFDRERDLLLKQLDDKDEYIHHLLMLQKSSSSKEESISVGVVDQYNNLQLERDSLLAMVHQLELELEQQNEKNVIYIQMEQELHSVQEQLFNRELLVDKLQQDSSNVVKVMEDYQEKLKQKEQELKEMERRMLEYEVQIDLIKEHQDKDNQVKRGRDRGCQTDCNELESVGVQVDLKEMKDDEEVDLRKEDVGVNTFVVKKTDAGVNTSSTSLTVDDALDKKPVQNTTTSTIVAPASKSEQRIQQELESTKKELKHYEEMIVEKRKSNKKATSNDKDSAVVAKEVLKTWKAQNEALRRELLSIVKGDTTVSGVSPSVVSSSSSSSVVVSKKPPNNVDETFITVAGDTFKIESSSSVSTPMIPSEVSSIKPIPTLLSSEKTKKTAMYSFKKESSSSSAAAAADEKDDQDFFRRSLDQSERRRMMLEEENKKIMSLVQQVADDLKLAKDVGQS